MNLVEVCAVNIAVEMFEMSQVLVLFNFRIPEVSMLPVTCPSTVSVYYNQLCNNKNIQA